MAGLLDQLKKRKDSNNSSVSDVIITSEKGRDPLYDVEEKAIHTERILKDIAANSAESLRDADQQPASGSLVDQMRRVVRRSVASSVQETVEDDNTPPWLHEEVSYSERVRILLDTAQRAILDTALPERVEQLHSLIVEVLKHAETSVTHAMRITSRNRDQAERILLHLLHGEGPLTPLFEDEQVTEVFVDSHKDIRVLRNGVVLETPFSFYDPSEYQLFIRALLWRAKLDGSESAPIARFSLNDQWGTWVNIVQPEITKSEEARICFRIPRYRQYSFYDLLQNKVLPTPLAAWLADVVDARTTNILVVGPRGSGKTAVMGALLNASRSDERIISIERFPELTAPSVHLERLIALPNNSAEKTTVEISRLVETAVERVPHRLVLAELAGEEASAYLSALERGFAGSLASIVADSCLEGLWRFSELVEMSSSSHRESIVRRVARSSHLVAAVESVSGATCLTELSEVSLDSNGEFSVVPIVRYSGVVDGQRTWKIVCEDSRWLAYFAERGTSLQSGMGLQGTYAPEEKESQSSV